MENIFFSLLRKKLLLYILIFFTADFYLFSDNSKGPLEGKNLYPHYFIYYNFPGKSIENDREYPFKLSFSYYLTQAMTSHSFLHDPNSLEFLYIDYENMTLEMELDAQVFPFMRVGAVFRGTYYYGGLLDVLIQNWHNLFGFPNSGRSLYPIQQVYVNIVTYNNYTLFLNRETASLGDTDVWGLFSLSDFGWFESALFGAFKIPTGSLKELSGSDNWDFCLALLTSFHTEYFSLHFQNSFVLPGDFVYSPAGRAPYPMYNGLLSIELHPDEKISLYAQFNVKTSPIRGNVIFYNNLGLRMELFSSPQTNLLLGVKYDLGDFKVQIYLEEDTFTNNGADFTLNFRLDQCLGL